jgi:nitrogen fixation protein NifU and related proteins
MRREELLELYKNPQNCFELVDATHVAKKHNPTCGDAFTVYAKVKNGKILDASFTGSGCAISTASCSLLTESLRGKTIAEVQNLHFEDMQKILDIPLSAGRVSCATLGLDAFKDALSKK